MRYVFIFLALVFFGGIAAVLAAPNFIDWNNHKPLLEEKLADAMSVPAVELHGDVSLKLFPSPSIYVAGATIKPYTGDANIAELEQLTANFSWSNIATLHLQAKSINIDSLKVSLVRMENEKANFIAERRSRRVSQPRSLYPLSGVDTFIINNFEFTYEDQPQEYTQKISIPNLEIRAEDFTETRLLISGTLNETAFDIGGTLDLESLRQVNSDVNLKLAENTLSFKGTLFDPFHQPMIKGDTTLKAESFAKLFTALNVEMPAALLPYKDLENVTFNADIMLNGTNFTVENAALTLPQGVIEGRISSKQKGPNGRPFHDIALSTNAFDFTSFRAATRSKGTGSNGDTAWSDTPYNLSFLEENDFKVSVEASAFKANGNEFDTVNLMLNNENKTLMIEDVTLGLDQGTARLNGTLKYSSTPNLEANLRFNEMPLRTFFVDIAPMLEGDLSGSATFKSKGESTQAMMNALNGEGEFEVTEGALLKTDFEDMVTAMRQLFKKQSSAKDTKFSNMKFTFKIENGTLRNDDLYLHTEKAAIKAEGKIDLASKTINYKVTPQAEAGLTDILVPVKVVGPLDSPRIVPDLTSSAGRGAAIGAVLGGPIGAAAGALVGSAVSGNNKKPDAPEGAAAEEATPDAKATPEQQTEEGDALPFELKNATPEEVREYFESQD